jgi:hypothetical protein
MKEEHPTTPAEPAPASENSKKFWSTLANIGNYLAAQAVPLFIGLASFIIAVDAWWSAKAVEWENDRALASVQILAESLQMSPDQRTAVTRMRIKNVGSLSFAILDMQITLQTDGNLTADWNRNSLIDANVPLPLGMKPLTFMKPATPGSATFHLDDKTKTFHIVDPNREVDLVFEQPIKGSGRLEMAVMLYTQPLSLADINEALTVPETIRGVVRHTIPEYGDGEVSDSVLYPYSAAHILVVPPLEFEHASRDTRGINTLGHER